MPLITAQDYIYSALRKIGQLRPGYTPQAELLSDGLDEFRLLYDNFNAERTMSYSVPDYILPITGGAQSLNGIYGQNIQYTLGPTFTVAAVANSTTTVTVANTLGLIIGQYVTGSHIAAGSYITAIALNTSITLSAAATGSGATTLSVAASFNIPRPEAIIRANLWMNSTSPTSPSRLPLSPVGVEQWANIWVLALTPINVTTVYYYDPQYPQGVLNLWPPLNGNSIEIFTWGFLTPPASLTTIMNVPPGYGDVISYGLAYRMWPMVTKDILIHKMSQESIGGKAMAARDKVRVVNAPQPRLVNDFGGSRNVGVGVSDWGLLLAGIPY